jgi:hypothetical protein
MSNQRPPFDRWFTPIQRKMLRALALPRSGFVHFVLSVAIIGSLNLSNKAEPIPPLAQGPKATALGSPKHRAAAYP